jgi:hypothetical protein
LLAPAGRLEGCSLGAWVEPRSDIRLGEDRQAVAHAGQVGALARGERVEVVMGEFGLAGSEGPAEQLEALGIQLGDQLAETDLPPRRPQCPDRVPEVG